MDASEEQQREAVLRAFAIDNVSSSDEEDEDDSRSGSSGYDTQSRGGNFSIDNGQTMIKFRRYVRGHIKRLVQAQICLHTYVDALQNDVEPSTCFDLTWGSWNMAWNRESESAAAALISAAAAESANSTPVRHTPRPLPPLSSLSRASSRLVNYGPAGMMDGCGNNSKSTGSSPLSPPAPPLSAGLGCRGGGGSSSNRSGVSTSSSSSSIAPFHYGANQPIYDPNHAQPPQSGRPTPPPTPPVVHHKRSFILSSSSFIANSFLRKSDGKFPTTPPPMRRHQTNLFSEAEQFPLTKSKSHEEHLSHRIEPVDPVIAT